MTRSPFASRALGPRDTDVPWPRRSRPRQCGDIGDVHGDVAHEPLVLGCHLAAAVAEAPGRVGQKGAEGLVVCRIAQAVRRGRTDRGGVQGSPSRPMPLTARADRAIVPAWRHSPPRASPSPSPAWSGACEHHGGPARRPPADVPARHAAPFGRCVRLRRCRRGRCPTSASGVPPGLRACGATARQRGRSWPLRRRGSAVAMIAAARGGGTAVSLRRAVGPPCAPLRQPGEAGALPLWRVHWAGPMCE
jgi:hypothetical protein